MKKIGLTGSIGTGKTTVAWIFQGQGVPIINADDIAHETIAPQTKIWKELFDRYGKKILLKDGIINRKELANIIFKNEHERKFVESIIHPKVHEEIQKRLASANHKNIPMTMVEIPLLFETKWDKSMDSIIVVRCDREQQIARCQEKFGMTRDEVLLRIGAQRSMEEKIAKADYVIDNSGSKSETMTQVKRIYTALEKGELHPRRKNK